jgi:hypothetical protein
LGLRAERAGNQEAIQQWKNAKAANDSARAKWQVAADNYNELVYKWIAPYTRTFAPSLTPRALAGMGDVTTTIALVVAGLVALLIGSAAAMAAAGYMISAWRGSEADVANGDAFHESGRKTVEAVVSIPEVIGKGVERAGGGFKTFAEGTEKISASLIQIVFAAALGYGIYWLAKNYRRGGSSAAPALTSSAVPAEAFKTVEAKVLS